MTILIVKMSALGDVVQALPVVSALKEAFGSCSIHWLVEEAAEDVVRSHPGLDRVLVYPRRDWAGAAFKPGEWPRLAADVRRLVRTLRSVEYDMVIDFQGLFKSGFWTKVAAGKRKIGFRGVREFGYLALNERVPSLSPDVHAVERYLHLVQAASGKKTESVRFGLEVPESSFNMARELIRDAGGEPDKPLGVLVTGTRWKTKHWNDTAFAEVADAMIDRLGLQIAFVGVKGDRDRVERILGRMKNPAMNFAGKTSVRTLMALLKSARVAVSVDSGPMHLAAALGTPVVAVFGPTAPWRTGPYDNGADLHRVVRADSPCSPCFKRVCDRPVCMESIRPEEVVRAIEDVLGRNEY